MIPMYSLSEVYEFSFKKLLRNRITPAHAETLLLNNNAIENIYYVISSQIKIKNSYVSRIVENEIKEKFSKKKTILEFIEDDAAQSDYIDNIFDSIINSSCC